MEAIEKIRRHPLYREYYEKLYEAEKTRVFCRHQMTHLLDVARIAYILNLEKGMGIGKDIIYAAALLHDIGKYCQYAEGTPHEIAGQEIAEAILKETGSFSSKDNQTILRAIREHRRYTEDMSALGKLLYESDKLSRACYACAAEPECNWDREKKNLEIKW